ncbi:MAG: YHS domain-containing (seleno)protein, partial [Planctomycetota bacterium]
SIALFLLAIASIPAAARAQATPPSAPAAEPKSPSNANDRTDAGTVPSSPQRGEQRGEQKGDTKDGSKKANEKTQQQTQEKADDATVASAELRKKAFRLDGTGLALQGYDPLSYFDKAGPKLGSKQYQHEERGVTYHFVSKENRDAFKSDPQKWEPPYGGWCAYAVIDGEKVEVDPTNFAIHDGKVYLFYKGFWGDALDKWQTRIQSKNTAKVLAEADAGWKKLEAADQAIVDEEQKAKAKKQKAQAEKNAKAKK